MNIFATAPIIAKGKKSDSKKSPKAVKLLNSELDITLIPYLSIFVKYIDLWWFSFFEYLNWRISLNNIFCLFSTIIISVGISYSEWHHPAYEWGGKPVWSSYWQSSHRWLPQQFCCIKRSQQKWGSNLSSTGSLQTQHIGTGPVGVLGKFGKGGTSLQNMQGRKSGARSVNICHLWMMGTGPSWWFWLTLES